MRKSIILKIMFILVSMSIFISDAKAYSRTENQNIVSSKKGALLCQYVDASDNVQVEIYINFKKIGADREQWAIFYNNGGAFNSLGTGNSFFSVFSGNANLSYQKDEQRITSDKEKTFTCPNNAFIDYTFNNEVCLSDSTSCGNNFEKGPFKLSENSIFNEVETYISNDSLANLDYNNAKKDGLTKVVINRTMAYLNKTYSFGTTFEMPALIKDYVEHFDEHGISFKNSPHYKKLVEDATKEIDEKVASGEITEEEGEELKKEIKEEIEKDLGVTSNMKGPDLALREYDGTCNSVLGSEMSKIVNNIFKFVQYLGPILVAIFTTIDFLNASLKGDQGEVKKASGKFVKRVVAAILLFFIPLICDLVFGLVGVTIPANCIGK